MDRSYLAQALKRPEVVKNIIGSYKGRFVRIPTDDLGSYTEENMIELTKRHVKLTEDAIRAHPEQWMWMHKRWKHATADPGPAEGTSRE